MSKPARLEYPKERLDALRAAFGKLAGTAIFTVWERVKRGEVWAKMPLHPAGCRGVTLDQALALYQDNKKLAGLGVKLGPIPGTDIVLFGVDYDGSEKGPLPTPWPESKTYAERSPSGGDKFHVLGVYKGAALEGRRSGAVEIYSEGRYFTLTGDRINGAAIQPTDPLPYYAAVGVTDPQPYAAPSASLVVGRIQESDLTPRERKLLGSVRGIQHEDLSARDYAVCAELVTRGATDEEAARVLCAGFPRDKLWKNKKYIGSTLAKARKGPSEAEAAQRQTGAVNRLLAFREESKAIGEGLSEEERLPPMFTLQEMVDELVFISDGSQVASRNDPRLAWTLSDFENLTAASVVRSGKAGRPASAAKLWLRHPQRYTVHTRTFRAGGALFCQSPGDFRAINTWREPPRDTPPKDWPQRAKPFLDHVAFLVPLSQEREFFLDWLSHVEQAPGVLPHIHVLMFTPRHGIGRNWLSSVLARVWAGVTALDVDLPHLLEGGFNGRLTRKLLAVVNEVREGSSANAYRYADMLRTLLTNETRLINPKYGRQYEEFNAVRWLMFSNHENALPLDRFDRRIYAIQNPDVPRPADYYGKLYAMTGDRRFIASVREFLRTRDIRTFNPGMHAPMTEAKRKVVEAGMSDADQEMQEIVAEYPSDCITSWALGFRLFGADASRRDRAALRYIAPRAGAVKYRVKVSVMGVKHNVWILRNQAEWTEASTGAVASEVERGMEASDAN